MNNGRKQPASPKLPIPTPVSQADSTPTKLSYSSGVVSVSKDAIVQNSNRILSEALKGNFRKPR